MSEVAYCEECGNALAFSNAHTQTVAGVEGPITLAFCSGCWDE